jgi:hypothetical protein
MAFALIIANICAEQKRDLALDTQKASLEPSIRIVIEHKVDFKTIDQLLIKMN